MTKKIDVKRILELRTAGMSQNSLTVSRHTSKHSVGDVFPIADEKGITYDSVEVLSLGKVCRMFFPTRHSVEKLYESSDYEYVHKKLMRIDVTLNLQCEEYQGRCTMLRSTLFDAIICIIQQIKLSRLQPCYDCNNLFYYCHNKGSRGAGMEDPRIISE